MIKLLTAAFLLIITQIAQSGSELNRSNPLHLLPANATKYTESHMVENGTEMNSVKFSVPDHVASDLIQQHRKIYPYYATGAVHEFIVSDQSGISYFPDADRGRTMVMYWGSKIQR